LSGTRGSLSGLLTADHRVPPHNFIGRIAIDMFRKGPSLGGHQVSP
jgi:hypothetical protein